VEDHAMNTVSVVPDLKADVFGGRKVIDVDTHLTEPHDLWTRRAPKHLRERVPQVRIINGKRSWVIDGNIIINEGAQPSCTVAADGSKWPGLEFLTRSIEECHAASYSVRERVEMIDALGISAQIVYPNILGFGGQHAAKVDPELRLACVQIYNDAMAEIQEESGGRIFPMALLPWWDAKLSAQETQRAHAMGLRGININSDPQEHRGIDGQPLPDLGNTYWDPLWETCIGAEMSVNFHIGASNQMMDWFGDQGWPGLDYDMRMGLGGAMLFVNNGRVMANIIYSGLCDRHEKLKFVSVESGIGWIPFTLEALDMQYRETGANVHKLRRLPSEYFATNFFACFWFERKHLTQSIRDVGIDNVLFETDFPHPICLYPIDNVEHALAGLTEQEKVKVLSGNAERLYKIKA
jgi:predicted TIM-barrel fold metal-dependent hydrolase